MYKIAKFICSRRLCFPISLLSILTVVVVGSMEDSDIQNFVPTENSVRAMAFAQ